MNGITIIEEHLCREVEFPVLIGFGIFITLLVVGALRFYILMWKHNLFDKKTPIIICSILIVVIYVVFWVVQINGYNDTHMEYTVMIDDSVSFNDFHTKYEIISVDGNEYRVVEKNNSIKE